MVLLYICHFFKLKLVVILLRINLSYCDVVWYYAFAFVVETFVCNCIFLHFSTLFLFSKDAVFIIFLNFLLRFKFALVVDTETRM